MAIHTDRSVQADPDGLERLRKMCTGPQEPEPPRRSLVVELVMSIAGSSRTTAPHHKRGGDDSAKVLWEEQEAFMFWQLATRLVSPQIMAGKEVLDVGCGWGGKAISFAQRFGPSRLVGFDLPGVFDPSVPAAVAAGLGLSNCEFTTGRAEAMPFEDDSFDVAFSDDVLEHVADPETVLRECRRVLRPGGTLIARLPSIRMAGAHHFDRCTRIPGLHYLMPMKKWAAGFNHYLLRRSAQTEIEPFSIVIDTPFRRGVTSNLNGMDRADLYDIALRSGLDVVTLKLVPYTSQAFTKRLGRRAGLLAHRAYLAARRGPLREPLSLTMILVARA